MRQIINNQYFKCFNFNSHQELSSFVSNQNAEGEIFLDQTYGTNYYSYVGYHSLTSNKKFVISFSSDESEDNLNLLFWNEAMLFVVDTGKVLFFIDYELNLKSCLEITSPVIGLYLTDERNLLVLEEASMRLINMQRQVLKSELFNLIQSFDLKDGSLNIQTEDETLIFKIS